MKVYTCFDCNGEFTRGRGRPPTKPESVLCEKCRAEYFKPKPGGITIRKVSADLDKQPSVKEPMLHGGAGSAITRPCPSCGYAYADGGYCSDCGWSKPVSRMPYGTATGKVGR